MLRLETVTKVFEKHKAVSDLSFAVEKGEVVGLLGENGAGKTTTLRMISTVLSPTSGRIEVNESDTVQASKEIRRQIGILFGTEAGLYDRLTARENIMYFGRLYGLQDQDLHRRIDTLADQFQMTDYIDKRTGGFSKGMKQKTLIARSIVHDPPVILFDEPTSGLDITAANEMRTMIRRFREQGKTVIFSTHIMDEVKRLCDRVVVLHKGTLQFEGPLNDLYESYHTDDLDDIFMRMVGVKA